MIVENLLFEAAVIFLLILANGFFAASEIAMIAIRKSRIDTMIEKGVKCALIIGRLKKDPDRFLATVQIGVTVVSSLASALGGAAAISFVKPTIEGIIAGKDEVFEEAINLLTDYDESVKLTTVTNQ